MRRPVHGKVPCGSTLTVLLSSAVAIICDATVLSACMRCWREEAARTALEAMLRRPNVT